MTKSLFANDEIDMLTEKMLADPQPGDHFQEMYSFHLYVVARDGDKVITMEVSVPNIMDNGRAVEMPRDGIVNVYDEPEDLRHRLSYKGTKGYWVQGVRRGENVTGWLEAVTNG